MVRLGCPSDLTKYIALDGDEAFRAHQAGAIPEWRDDGVLYFKRTKKIMKILDKLGITY